MKRWRRSKIDETMEEK